MRPPLPVRSSGAGVNLVLSARVRPVADGALLGDQRSHALRAHCRSKDDRNRTRAATQAPSTGRTRASAKAGVAALFTSDVVLARSATVLRVVSTAQTRRLPRQDDAIYRAPVCPFRPSPASRERRTASVARRSHSPRASDGPRAGDACGDVWITPAADAGRSDCHEKQSPTGGAVGLSLQRDRPAPVVR
jgi:hypothetical protein